MYEREDDCYILTSVKLCNSSSVSRVLITSDYLRRGVSI